jgi:hypothetical protein
MLEIIRYITDEANGLIWMTGILAVSITYFAGRLVSLLLAERSSPDGNIALGAMLISSLSAVLFTGMKTILLPVVLIFILFLVIHRSRIHNSKLMSGLQTWKDNVVLWTYFSIVFLLQYTINHRNPGEWEVGYPDNYVYITQINQLFSMKIEASSFELEKMNFGQQIFPQPYHYFEFWPAVLFKFITGKLSYLIFTLFLIPWLASIVLFQANRILIVKYNIKRYSALLIPILVFSTLRFVVFDDYIFHALKKTGINSDYFKFVFFQNYGYWHFFSYKFGVKLLVSGIFLTPIVYFYFTQNTKARLIYTAILPFASVLYLPFSLISALNCLIWERKKEYQNYFFFILLPLVGIPLFYLISGSGEAGFATDFLKAASKQISLFAENPLKICFTIYTEFFNNYYWLFMPLLFTATFCFKNNWVRIFCLWFISYPLTGFHFNILFKVHFLTGILTVYKFIMAADIRVYFRHILSFSVLFLLFTIGDYLFSGIVDFFQVYILTILPLIYIITNFIWGRILFRLRTKTFLITSIILPLIYFNFLAVFAENLKTFNSSKPDYNFYNELFGRMSVDKVIHSVYCTNFSLLPYFEYDRPGNDLIHYTDKFTTSVFSIDLFSREDTIMAIQKGVFHQFSKRPLGIFLKENRSSIKSNSQLRKDFLRINKVGFILRKKGYPRENLDFLNGNIIDSAFNQKFGYQVLKLQF